jgi:hypothetical protein
MARRKTPKAKSFEAVLLDGHKGPAVLVPFDPAEEWGVPEALVPNEVYGALPGHLVRGTLNGKRFEGWIGRRWGKRFVLVDEALRRAAKAAVGDTVRVVLSPS